MGTVHTTDTRAQRTLIGAGATSEALQEAIDHALDHGYELQLLGDDGNPAELLSAMQMVQALAAGHDLVCVWTNVGIGRRPTATAVILDPDIAGLVDLADITKDARR
jgi:hypothetical protein